MHHWGLYGDVTLYRLLDQVGLPGRQHFLKNWWGFEPLRQLSSIRLVRIPAEQVKFTDRFPFEDKGQGAVVGTGGGNWDRSRVPLDTHRTYRTLHAHFVEGQPWEDTPAYQLAEREISRGKREWQCRTHEDLSARCDQLERLWDAIDKGGYRSQTELWRENQGGVPPQEYMTRLRNLHVPDELRVAIGRNGEVIRTTSAKHRLVMAQLKDGTYRIPAIIQLIHAEYDGDLLDKAVIAGTEHPLVEEVRDE